MKTIKIGKYNWYLIREMAGKTLLFATENIVDGYFSDSSNNYSESKANAFLSTVFLNSLESPDFDTKKIVNGIWLLTSTQYENYIKPLNLPLTAPFLLRTAGEADDMVQGVNANGDVVSVKIKEKLGIRPGFMLDTEYVNELINKENQKPQNVPEVNPIVEKKVEVSTEAQNNENIKTKNENKNLNERKEQSNVTSTVAQPVSERIKPPISNPKNNTFQQQSQKNNQNLSKNKKNKKKKAKNKTIETVQPLKKQDVSSLYKVNNDELEILSAVDFEETNEDTVVEVKSTFVNNEKETQSVSKSIPVVNNEKEYGENSNKKNPEENSFVKETQNIEIQSKASETDVKTEMEVLQKISSDEITEKEVSENANINTDNSEFVNMENEDAEIVEIETLPEIILEKTPEENVEPVKTQTSSPFSKNPHKNKENSFRKFNKSNNETFNSTTQQNAKKGQNAIMNKLGAIDKPAENEMSTAIAAYTSGDFNSVINKQSQPSSYSQNMSEINQFTIEQLREILIKRNKQITKLKLSVIETTAEHEAMLENISKTKTEIENYKTEIEALNNQIEQMKKSANKNEASASEEKEELLAQHKKNIEKITEQLNETTNSLNEAKISLTNFSEKNKELSAKTQELLSALTEKENEINEYKKTIEEYKSSQNDSEQIHALNERVSELLEEKNEILSENSNLTEQLSAANATVEQLKKNLETQPLAFETQDVNPQEVQNLTNEIISMKADMVKALKIAKKLKEDLDTETDKTQNQSATIKELTEKLNEMHSENSGLKSDVERLKATVEESHNKIITTEEKLKLASEKEEELQSVIGNNTLTMQDMAAEISNLRKQNKTLNEEVAKSDTLTKTLLTSDKEKEEKIKELTEKSKENERNAEAIVAYEKTVTELQKELAEKDSIIKERDKTIKELSDNINSSYDDLSDFKKLIFEE